MNLLRAPVAIVLSILSLTAWQFPPGHPPQIDNTSTEPVAELSEEISGLGFWTAVACMGCIVGGVAIATRGWPAIVAAASVRKSSLVFGACIGACARTFGGDTLW